MGPAKLECFKKISTPNFCKTCLTVLFFHTVHINIKKYDWSNFFIDFLLNTFFFLSFFLISEGIYISTNFSNWHLKHNVLGKIIVLHNGCINFCPEKCNLGKIPIASQEMCFQQLKCFPVSSSTR